MRSFFDTLASVLEAGSLVSLALVDRAGYVHTRPARALRMPFRGQIWLRLGRDSGCAIEFEDGAEATVYFSATSDGPYVTVKGWAVILPAADTGRALCISDEESQARKVLRTSSPLACITATAAQLRESRSGAGPRVFAFPGMDTHSDVMNEAPTSIASSSRPERIRIAAKQSA